jgi:hypothetical protein
MQKSSLWTSVDELNTDIYYTGIMLTNTRPSDILFMDTLPVVEMSEDEISLDNWT